MHLDFKSIIKLVISIGIGIFLIWFIQKDLSSEQIQNIKDSIAQIEVKYILIVVILGAIACIIRAYRWEMLLKPLGYKPRISTLISSIFIMYIANLIFPRLGEVLRCSILQKEDDIPFEKSVGTMIVERLIDMAGMGIIALIGLALEYNKFLELWQNYQIEKGKSGSNLSLILGILVLGTLVIIGVFRIPKIRNFILDKLKGILDGLKSIFQLEKPILFIIYSISIYTIYFFCTYFLYFAFSDTAHLSFSSVFVVLTAATLGIGLTQGGIGAFQYLVMKTMELYGISSASGLAYAWASWLIQTANLIFFGLISWIYLLMRKNGKKI